jgi:exonuclease 3'-5' domain-containing protein 1
MDILAAQMGKASIASVPESAVAGTDIDPKAEPCIRDDKVKDAALGVTRKGKYGRSDVYVVDTADGIKALVQLLVDQASTMEIPLLYVDIEGIYLGRRGSISIIQLYMPPVKDVYLVDVHILGSAAFKTTTGPGPLQNKACQTLRDIFESTSITKVFYDLRADNDALFNLFSVNLDGVYDLQLAQVATRTDGWERNNRFVNGLAKSIKADAGLTFTERSRFESIKTAGQRLLPRNTEGFMKCSTSDPCQMRLSIIALETSFSCLACMKSTIVN